MIYDEVTS